MVRLSRKLKRARVGRFQVRTCNSMAAGMDEQSDKEIAGKKQRDQMLKLVSKGFYNELINYGVRREEVLRVASHLLDNLLAQEKKPSQGVEHYNGIFTVTSGKDECSDREQINSSCN